MASFSQDLRRRFVRGVAIVVAIAGGLLLLDAVVMLAWQERRALPGLDPSLLTNMRAWLLRLRDEARAKTRSGVGEWVRSVLDELGGGSA
jgi:hypothetical protein